MCVVIHHNAVISCHYAMMHDGQCDISNCWPVSNWQWHGVVWCCQTRWAPSRTHVPVPGIFRTTYRSPCGNISFNTVPSRVFKITTTTTTICTSLSWSTTSGPIVTPALILTFLLLTLGNYTPKGKIMIIIIIIFSSQFLTPWIYTTRGIKK